MCGRDLETCLSTLHPNHAASVWPLAFTSQGNLPAPRHLTQPLEYASKIQTMLFWLSTKIPQKSFSAEKKYAHFHPW